ncbi:MAG: YraN family protein [bacterium]
MDPRRRFGNRGEELAALLLERKGYRILERQWRRVIGEVDLIALDRDELVFVEVKSRKSSEFGFPEEAVGRKKLHTLQRLVDFYCQEKGWMGKRRIDVVAISFGTIPPEIHHLVGVS